MSRSQPTISDDKDNEPMTPTGLSSILSVPQRSTGVFQQLYAILSQGILEKPFFMGLMKQELNRPISVMEASGIMNQLPQENTMEEILAVDEQEFLVYMQKISKAWMEYQRNNKSEYSRIAMVENTHDLDSMVTQCYQTVPQIYFDEKYRFNFEVLSKPKGEIFEYQEELTTHLDEVEVNLFYQINSRFDQFLSVILNLNEIREIITSNQQKVIKLRQTYKLTKHKFSLKSMAIIKKQQQAEQLEQILQTLKLIQTTHKTCETMLELIKNQKYDQTLKLLSLTEQTYNQKLKSIDALQSLPNRLNLIRQHLAQTLTQNLIISLVDSMRKHMVPVKALQSQLTQVIQDQSEDSMANSSFIMGNDSWIGEPGLSTSSHSIGFLSKIDDSRDENFTKIFLQAVEIVDFSNKLFKNKIIEELKAYFSELTQFLVDHLSKQNSSQQKRIHSYYEALSIDAELSKEQSESAELEYLEEILPRFPIQVYIKIVTFFSECMQKVLRNQLLVNNSTINQLVNYNAQQALISAAKGFQSEKAQKQKSFDKMLEIVDELNQLSVTVLKFSCDKLQQLMHLNKLNGENHVKEFKDLLSIFRSWDKFHQEEMKQIMVPEFEDEKAKITQRCLQSYQKNTLNQLQVLRNDNEKQYTNLFHRDRLLKLRKQMEDEIWIPADIVFEFHEILFFLFGMKLENNSTEQSQNLLESQLDESTLLNNSTLNEKGSQFNQINALVNNNIFRIIKNEVVNENIKFKLTAGFLYFLSCIHDYFLIFESLQNLTPDNLHKLFEFLKLYNSLATQLILGAGAIHFGKMKTIAAKHLAISALCLRFFLKVFDNVQSRFISLIHNETQAAQAAVEMTKIKVDYTNHHQEIMSKVATLLQERFIDQCSELEKQNWNETSSKLTTPSKQTASVMNSTRQMYIVVEDLFPIDDLTYIFSKIVEMLKQSYISTFQKINISSKLGATRVKEELEYLSKSLSEIGQLQVILQGQIQDLDSEIEAIVQKKCSIILKAE